MKRVVPGGDSDDSDADDSDADDVDADDSNADDSNASNPDDSDEHLQLRSTRGIWPTPCGALLHCGLTRARCSGKQCGPALCFTAQLSRQGPTSIVDQLAMRFDALLASDCAAQLTESGQTSGLLASDCAAQSYELSAIMWAHVCLGSWPPSEVEAVLADRIIETIDMWGSRVSCRQLYLPQYQTTALLAAQYNTLVKTLHPARPCKAMIQ